MASLFGEVAGQEKIGDVYKKWGTFTKIGENLKQSVIKTF
jgi:hypothetical protein